MEKYVYHLFERKTGDRQQVSNGVTQTYSDEFSSIDKARDTGGFFGKDRYPKKDYRVAKYKVTYRLINGDVK